jgi:Fic family protein
MIWNNRHAWSGMIGSLFRPLDEGFVKSLAFMLTEEMDNCAEDYRQTDQHPIAAMNSEPYEVPSAYSLPDRMTEYYAFLQAGNVHPLIKAAVGQAYILVARPFPEGNERLSRMISSAVLLRSGYDFFRDISISSVIAKENYRYYKCMQEILRSENGGDLTYFMEYYLDLLVRALDSKKERERRRVQESLAREREMAR